MADIRSRLIQCFSAVFPDLSEEQIPQSSLASVGSWDSLATITLITLLEEEFEVEIKPQDLGHIVSFDLTLRYLLGRDGSS